MPRAPVIGIDLGTSRSVVAVYRKRKLEIIPNKNGERLTPSYVFYDPNNLEVAVGTDAEDLASNCPSNFIFDAKRIIGRKFDDAYVQELKTRSEYQFKIVSGENDKAEYEIRHDNSTIHKSPEQVGSEILKYLRESANEYLRANITETVISVPAQFSNAQRTATKAAAELAGLRVLKLVSEPVAGAIHYAHRWNVRERRNMLVFDMGGGTTDVSIVNISEENFEVLNVEGDTFLGGRDYDNLLVDYFKTELIENFNEIVIPPRLIKTLKEKCSLLKEKLSGKTKCSLALNCIKTMNDVFNISLTRNEYNNITDSITRRALHLVQKCLKDVNLSDHDIGNVLLIGGMTRMPRIREELRAFFDSRKINTDLNPDEAVALGAAIQASVKKNKYVELERYNVAELTPLSLGVETARGLMSKAITKNTPLPAKGCLKLATTENNQEKAQFKIFEGERINCAFNNLLGEFTINNLPKGKAGEVEFETNFFLNHDGILEVEAHETSTNHKKKLTVTLENYRLCQNRISNVIEDAEKNRDDDGIFEKYNETFIGINCVYNAIIYGIDQISSDTNREIVAKECLGLKSSLDNSVYTEINNLIGAYNRFRMAIEGIVGQAIDINWPEFS